MVGFDYKIGKKRYDKGERFVIGGGDSGVRELSELVHQILCVYLVNLNIVLREILRSQLLNKLQKITLGLFDLFKQLFK